ncbi:hypothetical protein JNL27_17645, partial [bacterium]|nr:hypothetical protein [bacterium]
MPAVLVFLVLVVALLFVRTERLTALAAERPTTASESVKNEEHVEVAEYMNHIHRYAHKLWFAAEAGNLPLAAFYLEELEETMEALEEERVIDEGKDLSALLRQYGLPAVHALEEQMTERQLADFKAGYEALLVGCNACHAASDHAF